VTARVRDAGYAGTMSSAARPEPLLFRDAAVLDPDAGELRRGRSVLVRDGRVAEVGGPELGDLRRGAIVC
jgi:hypothetical protein